MLCFCKAIDGQSIDDDIRLLFDGSAALQSIAAAAAAVKSNRTQEVIELE